MSLDERRAKFKVCHWQRKGGANAKNIAAAANGTAIPTPSNNVLRRASTGFGNKQNGSIEKQMPNDVHGHSKQHESQAEKQIRLASGKTFKETDVLEVWFMGCHADVGGGAVGNNVRHKLSQIPLRWMIRQCFECDTGIIFNTAALAEIGLDVHMLWPWYRPQVKPVVGPSPTSKSLPATPTLPVDERF